MRRFLPRLLLFVAMDLILLELVFRFVLPACELPSSVRGEDGFQVYDPGYARSGHYTEGSLPLHRSRWVINDAGWNSLFPYESPAERNHPLIAVIGDSGVESFYTSIESHIDTRLFHILRGECGVYAFGRQSQPLVEMTLLMERVDSLYEPDAFVLFIGHDVLRQSLLSGPMRQSHSLMPALRWGTFVTVPPPERQPAPFARIAMRSALVRYLLLNRDLRLFPLVRVAPTYHRRIAPMRDRWISHLLPMAGRYLFARISGMLGDRRLLIVVDDPFLRPHLLDPMHGFPRNEIIAPDFLLLESLSREYDGIDFMNAFAVLHGDYGMTGVSYANAYNRHLNEHGNFLVASAIARRLQDTGVLPRILIEWRQRTPVTGE